MEFLRLSWNIINICNLKCSYCIASKKSQNNLNINKNFNQVIENLINLNYKYYDIYLSGGEPTLNPYILEIAESFKKNKNTNVTIITNGTADLNIYKRLKQLGCSIDLSVHPQYIKKINFDIFNYIDMWMLMFYPSLFNIIKDLYIKLINKYKNINHEVTLLHDNDDIFSLTPEQLTWIKSTNKTINNDSFKNSLWNKNKKNINHNLFLLERDKYLNFNGFQCNGGINTIQINPLGFYRGALCDQFKYSARSLFIKGTKIKPEIVTCQKKYCLCNGNLNVPKKRINISGN